MLDDSRNMPIVIKDPVRLFRLYVFRFRGNVIHQNVVGAFDIVSLKKHKSAGDGPEALLLNSINDFDAGGIELEKHRSHGLDVLQFRELITNFDRHRRAAKGEKKRSGRRLRHDVRSNAFNAPSRLGQQAAGEPDDQDHQGNLYCDSHCSDKSAQRAVKEIADDQLTHHGCLFSLASPTRTNSAPAGGSSLKRSAGISSFMMTFVTCKSSL